jgi:hypothetical protein
MTPIRFPLSLLLFGGAPLWAQSFVDLTEVRNPTTPFGSVLQFEAGAIGVATANDDNADDERPDAGLNDRISWDARVWYRDDQFGSRRGTIEAYAGRDGVLASFQDGSLVGDDTVTRLELRGRPWQFYRDGRYRGSDFVADGLYEGSDWEAYLGFGREAQQGLYVEMGPFYRWNRFTRSDLAVGELVGYAEPEDFNAYGARLYLEQRNVQMDRRRGLPREGYVLTLAGEREWNDSDGRFGLNAEQDLGKELPSAVYRARGRLEWYIPATDETNWEIFARGGWHDETDFVQNADASRPLGHIWADAQLRLRIQLGQSMTLTPFAHGQFSKLRVREDALSAADNQDEFFFGGGVETYVHFAESISMHGFYSYLDNQSRPSIEIDEDIHGEHMFYLGLVVRFATKRRS